MADRLLMAEAARGRLLPCGSSGCGEVEGPGGTARDVAVLVTVPVRRLFG